MWSLPCSSCRTCSGIQGGTGRIVFWTSDIAWVLVGPRNQSGVTGYGAFAYIPACASQLASRNHLVRSEEHTSELQSLMRISYAVFCLKKTKKNNYITNYTLNT